MRRFFPIPVWIHQMIYILSPSPRRFVFVCPSAKSCLVSLIFHIFLSFFQGTSATGKIKYCSSPTWQNLLNNWNLWNWTIAGPTTTESSRTWESKPIWQYYSLLWTKQKSIMTALSLRRFRNWTLQREMIMITIHPIRKKSKSSSFQQKWALCLLD